MPTYEYRCGSCGHRFERLQSITDAPLRLCPKCKRLKAQRQIGGGGGLIFRGSGFYITDYRSTGYKEKAKAESDAAKPKPEKPVAKPGDKPDVKPRRPKPSGG